MNLPPSRADFEVTTNGNGPHKLSERRGVNFMALETARAWLWIDRIVKIALLLGVGASIYFGVKTAAAIEQLAGVIAVK